MGSGVVCVVGCWMLGDGGFVRRIVVLVRVRNLGVAAR